MNRPLRIVLTVLILGALFLVGAYLFDSISERARIRSAVRDLRDPSVLVRASATPIVRQLGPRAVPALLEAQLDRDRFGNAAKLLDEIAPTAVPELITALHDPEVGDLALAALVKVGPDAGPALIGALTDDDSSVRRAAAEALSEIGLRQKDVTPALILALKDEDPNVRVGIAQALNAAGRGAKAAVPALIGALTDDDASVRRGAAKALGKIAGEAKIVVPALVETLADDDPEVRRFAAEALARFGTDAKAAVPTLIEKLTVDEVEVRRVAAEVIGRIGPDAKEAVPALAEVLVDDDAEVRRLACEVLGQIGPDSKAAVPALTKALDDDEAQVRVAAAGALCQIGTEADESIRALIVALSDDSQFRYGPSVGTYSMHALGKVGPGAIPALVEALKHEKPVVRARAAFSLGQMGVKAQSAVPALIENLRDEQPSVRRAAAQALGSKSGGATRHGSGPKLVSRGGIGPAAKDAIPALLDAMHDDDESVRRAVGTALTVIDPSGIALTGAVPALVKGLSDEDPEVRKNAAKALGGGGGKTGSALSGAVPALVEAMSDENLEVRQYAAIALGGIGRDAKAAVPSLTDALRDDEKMVRRSAAAALGLIGPDAGTSVSSLAAAMKHEDVCETAAIALGQIRTDAKTAVPALIEAMQYENARSSAIRALRAFGPEAKPAVPALLDALSENSPICNDAESALRRIGTDAVPAFIAELEAPESRVRARVAAVLGGIRPPANDAIPALIHALEDKDAWVQNSVAGALGNFGAASRDAIPALIELMNYEKTRANSARALGRIGPDARAAIPQLMDALTDDDATVRSYAGEALGRIGAESNIVVPVLIEFLTDRDASVRRMSAEALGGFGPDAKPAFPALIDVLTDDDDIYARSRAASALGRIGPDASAAGPALIEALKHENDGLAMAAASALGWIDADAKIAVPALIEAMKREGGTRTNASGALGAFGPDAKAAVSALIEALGESNVGHNAAISLGKIGPDAIPALKTAAQRSDKTLSRLAFDVLSRMDADATAEVLATRARLNTEGLKAIELDGNSGHVSISVGHDGKQPITLEAWVKPDDLTGHREVICNAQDAGTVLGFYDGTCKFRLHDGTRYREVSSSLPATPKHMVHVAGVFDGRQMTLFVDGRQQGPGVAFDVPGKPSQLPFLIGANPETNRPPIKFFSGVIDDVRISRTARYLADFVPERPFGADDDSVAVYHFDDGVGDVAHDSSGNGFDGSVRGARSWNGQPFEYGVFYKATHLANSYLREQDWGNARREYRRALKVRPDDIRTWMNLLGVAWWDDWSNERSLDGVMDIYKDSQRALGPDRQTLEIVFVHAGWCLLSDQPKEYERLCRAAAAEQMESNHPRTQFLLSWLSALNEKPTLDTSKLVELARRAVEGNTRATFHRRALALCLVRNGQPEQAIEYLNNDDEHAIALVALVHARSGNRDTAKRWLEKTREALREEPLDPRSSLHVHDRIAWRLYIRETERILAEQ